MHFKGSQVDFPKLWCMSLKKSRKTNEFLKKKISADSKYYLFRLKNNIFLGFCLGIFESDTIKSDCPVQIFKKMMKYLKI